MTDQRLITRKVWHSVAVALLACLFLSATSGAARSQEVATFVLVPQTKIRLSAVEWRASEGEFREWAAVQGEYTVGADGTLSVPLIGDVTAQGLSTAQLAETIAQSLQIRTGLTQALDVSIQVVAYPPVYVTGNVQRPGEIVFQPGMTVIQAVALAGGRERRITTGDQLSDLDQIRYSGELNRIELQIAQQLARRSRLQAELDNKDEIEFSTEFLALLGEPAVAQIKDSETILFHARKEALERQLASLMDLGRLYRREIEVLDEKMAAQDHQIDVALAELESVSELAQSGVVTRARLAEIERTVADLQSSKLDMAVASMRAQQQLSASQRDAESLRGQRRTDISRDLQDAEIASQDLALRSSVTRQLLRATGATLAEGELAADLADQALTYSVIRAPNSDAALNVTQGDVLLPGDVLQVKFALLPGILGAVAAPGAGG